ncbi:MAG: hypothetical protein ACRYG8_30540, partial [Janthinobacterium lividum]
MLLASVKDRSDTKGRVDPDRLIFVDETWAKTNMTRARGWATRGERLVAAVPGRGRVARPFGSALTDPGRRLSRTRLFPEVTRI